MLSTTGRKEKLSASKGSEIEASSNEYENCTGNIWYSAVLEENLAKSKRKKLSVRHLDPLLKEDYRPPVITTTFHRLIRPVPPQDPFPDVDFEEGDMIDAAHNGGWWSGWVLKALGNRRFSVYLRFEPDVLEFDRRSLRPHLVWKDDEWFRCEKRVLTESEFSAGKAIEVRIKEETFGDVWVPGMAIKEKEDGTVLVKYKVKSLSGGEDECAKISVPFSRIQPLPPPSGERVYDLMENVHVRVESGWCPGVISKVLLGKKCTVKFGQSKMSMDVDHSKLRPSVEWKDGVWKTKEKVLGSDESPHVVEETTASTRIRVTIRKPLRATRSSSSAMASSNGGDVAEAGIVSVTESETPLSKTVAQLCGDLGSEMAHAVMNGNANTPVANQVEIAATKEFHSSVVLGVAATPVTKTQGKTTPRKKLQTMKNQKSSSNDSVREKAPEETNNRESVNKRKRGQPRKFISTEPKEKTGVAGSDSNPTTTEIANMDEDDDTPLASWINGGNSSSGQSGSQTPDPMLNSVVEKHVDVVKTPLAKESTMVLPFAKKSPCWKVLEAMEIFKFVPQRPHFIPLLENEEESREGEAIGAMVTFTGLLEKVNNLQVDDSVSAITRINECFDKLEKHGFDVTAPRSRVCKLLSIKESQGLALQELQVAEREIAEKDKKRRKCEENIEDVSRKILELQKQQALLKEAKVTMNMEIDRMQSHAAVLDQKVQSEEHMFRTTVAAPWN
uniref:Agenet domain-containing protein n=1 Tax=Noccaea caerulescens TaxID=107243 RepID=A0A1J3HN01_NOCCA